MGPPGPPGTGGGSTTASFEGELPSGYAAFLHAELPTGGFIKGTATDSHKEWIDVRGFSFELTTEIELGENGAPQPGEPHLTSLEIVIPQSGPEVVSFAKAHFTGEGLKSVTLDVATTGTQQPPKFFQIFLDDVSVVGTSTRMDSAGTVFAAYRLQTAKEFSFAYFGASSTPLAKIGMKNPQNEGTGSLQPLGLVPVSTSYSTPTVTGDIPFFSFDHESSGSLQGGFDTSLVNVTRSFDMATLGTISALVHAEGIPALSFNRRHAVTLDPLFWLALSDAYVASVKVSGLVERTTFAYDGVGWNYQPPPKNGNPQPPVGYETKKSPKI